MNFRKEIRKILRRHLHEWEAEDIRVEFDEDEWALKVQFTLSFGEGSYLPGLFMVARFPTPDGLYPVMLSVTVPNHPKRVPPWVEVKEVEGGIYLISLAQLAKEEEVLEAVERLYVHMAILGETFWGEEVEVEA